MLMDYHAIVKPLYKSLINPSAFGHDNGDFQETSLDAQEVHSSR